VNIDIVASIFLEGTILRTAECQDHLFVYR